MQLAGCMGGCGLRQTALAPYAHAAMHAAHAVNRERMAEIATLLGVNQHFAAAYLAGASELADARDGLMQAGVDVGGSYPTLSAEAAARYMGTPWGQDVPASQLFQPRPSHTDAGTRPRLAGALFMALDALEAADIWAASDCTQRAIQLSAGGRGSGAMWTMRGLGQRRALQNAHFREALRMRMGCLHAPAGRVCQLRAEAAVETGGGVCGQMLVGDHGLCLHPLTCDVAAARLRPHRAAATALGRAMRACGAAVDYERHAPHVYQWGPDSLRYVEAILDVATSWPGGSCLRSWDVAISCPQFIEGAPC